MKKFMKYFLLIAMLTLCVACGKKEEEKEEPKIEPFDLKEEYYQKSEIVDVDLEGLEKLIDEEESFGLYVYLTGCSSCAEFKEVLTDFQDQNNLKIYSCEIRQAIQTDLKDKIKYAPSFVVYKEGKIVAYLDAESNDDLPYYKTADSFKEWLTKYINLK